MGYSEVHVAKRTHLQRAKKKIFEFVTIEGKQYLKTALRGRDLLQNPTLNKGTAFTDSERDSLGLRGLLPSETLTISQQCMKLREGLRAKPNDIQKFIFLQGLMDRNETLYYRFLLDDLEELLPIVYTPTVGLACKEFAHIFRRTRGLYITYNDRDKIDCILDNWQADKVQVAVITDGERILGLGDLGTNGMGISIGKLALYTAAGGLHPAYTMPICLDVGTNNNELASDPLYLGTRHRRITAQQLDRLVGTVLSALNKRFPGILVQFEDFALRNSFRILDKFRNEYRCFNDDIQGTGSVALAGILSSLKITKKSFSDMKFVIVGAGSAGIGIANQIKTMLVSCGLAESSANERIFVLRSKGLLDIKDPELQPFQKPYARDLTGWKNADLASVIKEAMPDVLIGTTGQHGLFNRHIIQLAAKYCERPLIMPLSNPTSCSEATPEEVINVTKGRGLVATGSPFPPVNYKGKTHVIGQCNNVYIFPGVGLGVVSCKSKTVSDMMFIRAARTLASMVTENDLENHKLYPDLKQIRKICKKIAIEVVKQAIEEKLTRTSRKDTEKLINNNIWVPEYLPYIPA